LGLSTRDARADERGVMLPFAIAELTGVLVPFTRGVGGVDLTEGVVVEAADRGGGVPVAATRGVRGVRVVRFAVRAAFNGRLLLPVRSVDIGAEHTSALMSRNDQKAV
jgi:hypothetical protein